MPMLAFTARGHSVDLRASAMLSGSPGEPGRDIGFALRRASGRGTRPAATADGVATPRTMGCESPCDQMRENSVTTSCPRIVHILEVVGSMGVIHRQTPDGGTRLRQLQCAICH